MMAPKSGIEKRAPESVRRHNSASSGDTARSRNHPGSGRCRTRRDTDRGSCGTLALSLQVGRLDRDRCHYREQELAVHAQYCSPVAVPERAHGLAESKHRENASGSSVLTFSDGFRCRSTRVRGQRASSPRCRSASAPQRHSSFDRSAQSSSVADMAGRPLPPVCGLLV